MRHVIQRSLFDEKESFNQDDFIANCTDDAFVRCVSSGICSAIEKVSLANLPTRLRVRSDSVHDVAFTEIQNYVSRSELHHKISFRSDMSGNKRLYFMYNNYLFILRKSESGGNKSGISDIINSQEADSHVITVEYVMSSTLDKAISISFQYIRNNVAEMIYYIPVIHKGMSLYAGNNEFHEEVKDAKATLKIVARKVE